MHLKNKFLKSFLDQIDFLVRFIYCRLGIVSRVLNKLFFWKFYSSVPYTYLDEKFQAFSKLLTDHGIDLHDKTVLELGPGNSYINTYNFLINGVKKVYLVDKYPRFIKSAKQRKRYEDEIEFIKNKFGKDIFFLDKENKIKYGYVELINKDLTEIDDLKVDFIYSSGVLEHVRNIEDNIRKMSEVLVTGGYCYHYINMMDHYNFNNPFLFYKYSDHTWNKFLTKEGLSYTNRWRYSDFIHEFTRNKLKTVYENKIKFDLKKIKINKRFRNYEDLDIGMLHIILKKEVDAENHNT